MATPKFIGNWSSSGSRGEPHEGVGVAGQPSQAGGGSMTGKSGDIGYIPMSAILPSGGLNQSVFFQSEVGVDIDYTLCGLGLATSSEPAAQAACLWTDSQTVAANAIVKADVPGFNCMRVTFNGNGTLYVGAL
jgi:hypothetical protein